MPQLIADRRDIDFVLFEQLDAHKLCRQEIYGEFNRKTIEMIVSEARSLAINEILPTLSEGDRQGLSFD
ncbi:MAG: acyl-CoA dehydrogenase N-terminal domain-containing protein, partial [Deltaproteobacteria bacterium]|nr:acyl-CoA dehydrogenase N-terminal domain-containing protein [Deltaproteobacteria bacterium]